MIERGHMRLYKPRKIVVLDFIYASHSISLFDDTFAKTQCFLHFSGLIVMLNVGSLKLIHYLSNQSSLLNCNIAVFAHFLFHVGSRGVSPEQLIFKKEKVYLNGFSLLIFEFER